MRSAAILLALIGSAGAARAQESNFVETDRVTLRNGNFLDGIIRDKTADGVLFSYSPTARMFIRWGEIRSIEEITIRHVTAKPKRTEPPPPPPPAGEEKPPPPPEGKDPSAPAAVKLPKISEELQRRVDDLIDSVRSTPRISRGRYAGMLDALGTEARQYMAVRIELLADDLVRWVGSEIGRSQDRTLVPELRRRLQSERPVVRAVAIQLLQEMKDLESGPYVVRLLRDPDESVRAAASIALPDLGDESAIDPLARMTREPSGPTRKFALRALVELSRRKGRLGDVVIYWRNNMSGLNPGQREDVADAAGQLIPSLGGDGDPVVEESRATVQEMLISLSTDIEPAVRGKAFKSLGKLTAPTAREAITNALTSELNETALVAVIETVQELRDRAAIPGLIESLGNSSDKVRNSALVALKFITGETAMTADQGEWQEWLERQK